MTDTEKVAVVTETRLLHGVDAAQMIWLRLGMEVVPGMIEAIADSTMSEYLAPEWENRPIEDIIADIKRRRNEMLN